MVMLSALVLESEPWWSSRRRRTECSSPPRPAYTSMPRCDRRDPPYQNLDRCYYECSPGCYRVDSKWLLNWKTCDGGHWTGIDIVCAGCCSLPPWPKDTYMNCGISYAEAYKEGTVCSYYCSLYWHIPDYGSTTRTCSKGVWTGTDMVCKRKEGEPPVCSSPPRPANAIRKYCSSSPPTSHGVYCRYECIPGYFHRGGNILRTCVNGVWDGRDTVCVRMCPSPAYTSSDPIYILDDVPIYISSDYGIPISFATRSDCHFPYLQGARCSFRCNPGFIPLYGSNTRTCSNGNWTGTNLACWQTGHPFHWQFYQNRQWDLD
ncbi:CUB and sushi domain-containing protein 3-like [Branchiostoma floridae]|uniref:CUB and sushi domain-containing protein 3-like n=1 Tax=Branchiostoma floridae TaxID=7739 RepID=A0A9J7N9H1_BRAFL|nr:CUB and sushi domain-containing protein 3-like [Branchiostoma floridae]